MDQDTVGGVMFQELDANHARLPDFLQFLQAVAPDQVPFVVGEYYARYPSYLLAAVEAGEIAGAIRFAVQPIGPEARCPVLCLDKIPLTEARIHVFAVRPASRGRGIGTQLQKWAIERARGLGCHQVASYSSYDREANYHVKLSLGFAAQPEVHGDNERGVYFLMPLDRKPKVDHVDQGVPYERRS
jgi:GNAT superfamily N-acetyltransferase